MHAHALRALLVTATVLAAWPAGADPQPQPCRLPSPEANPLADRADLLAQYERLPRPCLRALFTACSQAAGQGVLDFGSAAACSFDYEALLSQDFDGSFPAFMAWWQSQQAPSRQ
jgi:hypothetical protein